MREECREVVREKCDDRLEEECHTQNRTEHSQEAVRDCEKGVGEKEVGGGPLHLYLLGHHKEVSFHN